MPRKAKGDYDYDYDYYLSNLVYILLLYYYYYVLLVLLLLLLLIHHVDRGRGEKPNWEGSMLRWDLSLLSYALFFFPFFVEHISTPGERKNVAEGGEGLGEIQGYDMIMWCVV